MESQAMLQLFQQQTLMISTLQQSLEEIKKQVGQNSKPTPEENTEVMNSLANNLTEFMYDPENGFTFDVWYKRYDDLFLVDGVKLTDAARARLLVRKLSSDCHERYINHILPQHPRDLSFPETVDTLKTLFGRTTSLFHSRFKCLQLAKQQHQDIVTYAGVVNKHCEDFKLKELTADHFKCLVFICGLHSSQDTELRTRLLVQFDNDKINSTMTLNSLVKESQVLQSIKQNTALIVKSEPRTSESVNLIGTNDSEVVVAAVQSKPRTPCWQCGQMHFSKDCSFNHHKCKDCGKIGHKEGYCACFQRNYPRKQKPAYTKQERNGLRSNFVRVNQVNIDQKRRYITIGLNSTQVVFQIDTGSDLTIVSEETWKKLGKPEGHSPTITPKSASGDPLIFIKEINCQFSFREQIVPGKCFVSSTASNLLGTDLMDEFNLWNIPLNTVCNQILTEVPSTPEEVRTKFPKLFQEKLGLCTKIQIRLHTCPNIRPVFRPKRPVPFAVMATVEKELKRLEDEGAITPVQYSEWAAPIVVVKKSNGKMRICADYSTGLNAALEPHCYPLPLPQEIFSKISTGRIFSHIDLSDAFLQVEVDEESRNLLTINTHLGLFKVNRLSQGVKPAPNAFQQVMDSMLAGVPGAAAYIDDIIISGETIDVHNRNLQRVLEKIQEYGFHLKLAKCKFFMNKITYLGYIISQEGIQPDPERLKAIREMPEPSDKTTLRSFLGAINYYGKFVDSMRRFRGPLDELLKKDAEWNWSERCQRSFTELKEVLSSNLLLTHYDPELEIVVAADASNYGLGGCIMHLYQDGTRKTISHASRSLTPAERGYSQIEKEALALVFAVTKFHRMIFGRKFILETDHKPLLAIFGSKKGIPVYTANRIQRWALVLLTYDFTIKYVSTADFGHADVLSRLIHSHTRPDEDYVVASVNEFEDEVRQVAVDSLQGLPITFRMINDESKRDILLQSVVKSINSNWSKSYRIKDLELKQFHLRKDSLSVIDDSILYGGRVVIPSIFRKRTLTQLHKGHPGMERMKSIIRNYVYWPSIDKDVENFVRGCIKCSSVAKNPTKHTLSSWPTTNEPWERLHVDFAGLFEGMYFLVIVDSHSKWPEIFTMPQITTAATISRLEETFSRFGVPKTIVSDNGTQFTSWQFQQFCLKNGIEHITSAPFHPQSNGQAERFVDTLKRSLKKLKGEGKITEILQTFLSVYRTTPNKNTSSGKSPSESLIGRRIRTPLDLILPKPKREDTPRNTKMESQFNLKHGATPRSFQAKDNVYAKRHKGNSSHWTKGTVIEKRGKVMYNVLLDDGLVRSHINQLRPRFGSNEIGKHSPLNIMLNGFEIPKDFETRAHVSVLDEPTGAEEGAETNHQPVVEATIEDTQRLVGVENDQQPVAPTQLEAEPRRSARNRKKPMKYRDFVPI